MNKRITEIGKNHNGNHKRTIKDLEEVIENLKEDQEYQKNIKRTKILGYTGFVLLLLVMVSATISYSINGSTELKVLENEVIIGDNMDNINDYFRLDVTNSTPLITDCNSTEHFGRTIMKYDGGPPSKNKLYICTDDGWVSTLFS